MTRWYAVADESAIRWGRAGEAIWTVSTDPNEPGWITDNGIEGYGLMREDAEFLAAAANEKLQREGKQ